MPPKTSSPGRWCSCSNCARSPSVMTPPMPISIQFFSSGGVFFRRCWPPVSRRRATNSARKRAQTKTAPRIRLFELGNTRARSYDLESVSKQRRHVGAVRFFVAAGRPARSLRQETGVIDIANKNPARFSLLLEMAIQTQRRVSRVEHALVDRAVR